VKVAFLVSFLEVTGGHVAVVEIGERLVRRGHEVTIVYPARSIASRRNDALRAAGRIVPDRLLEPLYRRNSSELDWFPFSGSVLRIPELEDRYLPRFDAIVATAWRTAERAARFETDRGRRFYLIQHYETWSGPEHRVDATWQAPFVRIATAEWLRTLGRERFGIEDLELVPYGVDLDTFWPDQPRRREAGPLRIGMLYHREPWKGVADAFAAVASVRRSRPVELVAFSTMPAGDDVPTGTEFHLYPTRDELRRLYSSLDVFLCASLTETGPLTVPEAMACGVAVVATDVGNVALWTAGGEGAFVVLPGDVDALADALELALSDEEERRRRAERGRELVQAFTWERSTDAFEAILRRHV
jgi:glycosyltransferase involved in cell wall biosynthesis